jgi:two-component system NtrC family sensor kinase
MPGPRGKSTGKGTGRSKAGRVALASGLLQMMEQADVLIAVTDVDGHLLAWNPALAKLTGRPAEAGLGNSLFEWLSETSIPDLAIAMREVAATRRPIRCEVRLPGTSGTVAEAAFSVLPIFARDGQATAVMAAGHDLTALRALQSQVLHAEKLATVGQIAAGVAHEINNPLTSVQMCVEAVLRKATWAMDGRLPNAFDAADLGRLHKIQEGAERIRKFSRDLTTYARPSGHEIEEVALNDVVEHALSFCEHVLDEAKAALTRALADDLPPIRVVRDHIMQVVTNLVSNAAQALGDIGGNIVITTFRHGPTALGLSVSDDGEGIREEDRDRVFEPFFTTKPAGRGTGLGLPVVRNIVLAHGGQVGFEPRPGGGTVFTVVLPLESRYEARGVTEKQQR